MLDHPTLSERVKQSLSEPKFKCCTLGCSVTCCWSVNAAAHASTGIPHSDPACLLNPDRHQVSRSCFLQVVECLLRLHEVQAERFARPQLGLQTDGRDPAAEGGCGRGRAAGGGGRGRWAGMSAKRPRSPTQDGVGEADGEAMAAQEPVLGGAGQQGEAVGTGRQPGEGQAAKHVTLITSRPAMEARGHTGYLTFARKWVDSVSASKPPEDINRD